MNELRRRLLERFHDKEYRHSYLDSFLDSLISGQIRGLRERAPLTQSQLADAIGTTQSAISRLERPDYSSWRLGTLKKLAQAFDVALSVKFVSFGDALDDVAQFDSTKLLRPAFEADPIFQAASDSYATVSNLNDYRRLPIDTLTLKQRARPGTGGVEFESGRIALG